MAPLALERYPTFELVGLRCDDFALIPVHDVVISPAVTHDGRSRVFRCKVGGRLHGL